MTALHKRIAIPQGDGTSLVPLSRGFHAVIDDGDAPLVTHLTWSARPDHSNPGVFYAVAGVRRNGMLTNFRMHNLILPPPAGLVVDHENRNPLDNRRKNLRFATQPQNAANRKRRNTTGFIGVYPVRKKFSARVRFNGHYVWSGCFETALGAAVARDAAAFARLGEFAVLNFPKEIGQ